MGDAQLHGSIFLSHTGKDNTGKILTPLLYNHLKQENPNRRVFIDETGIKVGANLTDVIKSAIEHCDVFVAIVTEQYLHSKWPLLELHWGREYGRPVFAALVDVTVDEVKRWVRSDQALEVWKHEKLIQEAEGGALEQTGHVLSAEALRADVLGLFGAKVLAVTLDNTKFCWIHAASLIASNLLEQHPGAGWPVDQSVTSEGGIAAREPMLQYGGKWLLQNLQKRAQKVGVSRPKFQRLETALGSGTLLQVVCSLCVLVEHDGGQLQEAPADLLDELSAVLDDVEVLITKAAASAAAQPSELQVELEGVLGRLHGFSSWNMANELRRAEEGLTGDGGTAHMVDQAGDAAAAGDTPEAAVAALQRIASERGDGGIAQRVLSQREWRARIHEHLQFEVFQHLNDLVPDLADMVQYTPAIGIVGMGGIGKTTVARAVRAMLQAWGHFHKVVFVAVGHKCNRQRVVASMWKQVFGGACPAVSHTVLLQQIITKLKGARVLLVLDDVWTAEVLRELNFVHVLASNENRIIVTSRVRGIFAPDDWRLVEVPKLVQEHARELLCWHAFDARQPAPEFEEVVQGVVKECKGLPLMLEVTGASLKGADVAGWQARLQQLQAVEGMGDDDDVHEQLQVRVKKSTDVLPPLTKRCFILLSMWPEDAVMHRQELVNLFRWVCPFQTRTASEWAQEQVNVLHAKCLLTHKSTNSSAFIVHDILRDVALQDPKRTAYLLDYIALEASAHVHTTARVLRLQGQHVRELSLEAHSAQWLEVEASTCEKVVGASTCKPLRLLRLQSCPIREFPDAGAGMLLLCVLEVLYCPQLQCLPVAISSMVHLERISLDGCTSMQSLPASISGLGSLQHVSLRGCKAFTGLPHSVRGLQQLTALLLAECYSLAELPNWVASLSKLQVLDMRSCQSVMALPPQLHLLTSLRSLDVRLCSAPVVEQAQRFMPSLGQHRTINNLLKWYTWTSDDPGRARIWYFEPEVFMRVLVHLQTVPAARVIVRGGKGEGKSQLCEHVVDYFKQVRVEFGAPVFPDGFLLLRLQSVRGSVSTDGKVSQAWLHEQLCAIHKAIFTRINGHSHDGPLWRYIASQRDIAGVGQSGNVTAVKQCIRALLAGQRLLLIIDDAGPLMHQLFGTDGAIPPSFPGACLATVSHAPPCAHLPAAVPMLPMCTGYAACERILKNEADVRTRFWEAHKAVGAQLVTQLAHNPGAVKLLGRLLCDWGGWRVRLLAWDAALEALDAAGGGEAVAPLQLAYAVAGSCLTSRHGAATGHFLGALQRLPADTLLPAAAVAAVCRAGADDVTLPVLPSFLEDLIPLLRCWSSSLKHEQQSDLLPEYDFSEGWEGCVHVDQCFKDAIASAARAACAGDQLMPEDFHGERASNPSDRLVAACVVGLLGTCSHATMPTERLVVLPPEQGEWQINWRAAFCDLGIHPAWLVQLLDTDATLRVGKQLLFSAATGRLWRQLVVDATKVLSHSVHVALGVLPLLLCRDAKGRVLWEAKHTDAVLVAIRHSSSVSENAAVIKLCSALAAREVSPLAAVSIMRTHMRMQHDRDGYIKDLPECQLLCQLRAGQFAPMLLQASRAAEGPVMAHTMGAAALGLRRHAAAVTHLQQAHDAFQREYGQQHAGTIESGAALARAHLGVGNYHAALAGFQQVEDATSCSLGPCHPATFMAQADVALALRGLDMGKQREAEAVVATAQSMAAAEFGQGSAEAVWWQGQQQSTAETPHHTTQQRLPARCLIQVLMRGAVAYDKDADTLLLQEGQAETPLARLPDGVELLGVPAPTRVGAVVGVRIRSAGTCDVALVLSQLLALQRLDLEGVHLGADGAQELADQLVDLSALTGLRCNSNWLGPAGADVICKVLPSLQQLRELRVILNDIGSRGAASLARVLPDMTCITALDIGRNDLGEEGAVALARALPRMRQLLLLGLEGNGISAGGMAALARSVKFLTKLQDLSLARNSIGNGGAAYLGRALASLTGLTALSLYFHALRGADMQSLKGLVNLQKLNVSANAVGDDTAAAGLRTLPALTALTSLSAGYADVAVVRFLAPGLKATAQLRKLGLYNHKMGPEGASALAAALPTLTALTYLDVDASDGGGMGVEGVTRVAPELKKLQLLAHLDLARNAMGTQGVGALADAMPSLTALTYLNLSINSIRSKGAAVLGPALTHLSRLVELWLNDGTVDEAAFEPVAHALATLPALMLVQVPRRCEDSTRRLVRASVQVW